MFYRNQFSAAQEQEMEWQMIAEEEGLLEFDHTEIETVNLTDLFSDLF